MLLYYGIHNSNLYVQASITPSCLILLICEIICLTNLLHIAVGTINQNTINLVFEGLDTIATVHINGIEVGKSQNQFVRYIFNIKENHLKVSYDLRPCEA